MNQLSLSQELSAVNFALKGNPTYSEILAIYLGLKAMISANPGQEHRISRYLSSTGKLLLKKQHEQTKPLAKQVLDVMKEA